MMPMTPLSEKDRLRAALTVARHLHENLDNAESLPSGTILTPIGTENGNLLVAIGSPDGETADAFERVACAV
jgi:hypothetical protein